MPLETRRKTRWNAIGINDSEDLKEHIENIFIKHEHQEDVLIDIYKLVFPDWDQIEKINGFPEAGHDLWQFICRKFIEFDQRNHPKIFKGGLWLDKGFSSNGNLGPWEINFQNCRLQMK